MQDNNRSVLPGSQGGARVFKSWRLPKPRGKCRAEIHPKAKTTQNSWAPTESQSTYEEIPSPTAFSFLRELAKGERQWDPRWAPTQWRVAVRQGEVRSTPKKGKAPTQPSAEQNTRGAGTQAEMNSFVGQRAVNKWSIIQP